MRARLPAFALLACSLWGASTASAQTTPSASPFTNQFPDPLQYAPPVPDPPDLLLQEVREIKLPGPLRSGPVIVDGRVEIRTADGLVRIELGDTTVEPTVESLAAPGPLLAELPWSVSPDGTHRARPAGISRLLLQKSCRGCQSGWRKGWRLRVAGLAQVPPLVTERRVYYGAADNQVYSVKRKNGHRVWVSSLDGRVVRPISLWIDPEEPVVAEDSRIAALLVVPEPGAELVVLDSLGGRPSLRYRPKHPDDRLVGAAMAIPDGRVVLARQGYAPEDASLIVLEVRKEPGTDDPAPSGYNPPTLNGAAAVPAR